TDGDPSGGVFWLPGRKWRPSRSAARLRWSAALRSVPCRAGRLQQRGTAQPALQVVLEAGEREALGGDGGRARRVGQGTAELATEDAPHHPKGVGVDASAGEPAARRAQHAALLEVEGGERTFVVATPGAAVEQRMEAFEREQLPEERGAHE